MATTHLSNSNNSTLDALITPGATIANGSWSGPTSGVTINNIGVDGTTESYILGDVIINMGTGTLVTGSGTPYFGIHINEQFDGTNYEPTQAAAQPQRVLTMPLVASTTYTTQDLVLPDIPIHSTDIIGEILNQSGGTTPASMTVKMQRHTFANW